MKTIYCDINHIEEGIEKLNENEDITHLAVYNSRCVMRGITGEEAKERNVFADNPEQVCRIEHSTGDSYTFHFHETQVSYTQDFCFNPRDSSSATDVKEMGENLRDVVNQLEEMYRDLIWDFGGVEAQSYGRDGKTTDFEFEYELIVY
jgi:hypothetical protein